MDSPPPKAIAPRPDVLSATLAWIEQHLHEPLSVQAIAIEAGLSPYHYSRLFTARMGRSVMAYVRGRRLLSSARRLVSEPDLRIIDLAFDSGFESQEAYTRAFKRIFGVAPARFRQGHALTSIQGQYPMTTTDPTTTDVALLPERVHRAAFTVAGYARRFDDANKAEIQALWPKLVGALPFEGQVKSWDAYGVIWSADRTEGSFHYMAAVEIQPGGLPPAGMEQMTIPAATYMVFRITLDGGPVHPQIKAAMARIWGELIPASGATVIDGPDFELMTGEFSPTRPGAIVDFYVPVEQ